MIATTISVTLNGAPVEVGAESTLADVLRAVDIDPAKRGIAVAVDESVVPRSQWEKTTLEDGADIEVITAFQGG